MEFGVELERSLHGSRIDAGPRAHIVGGAPPEFGGTADVWSPEHLLVAAAALCYETTFEWHARRDRLEFREFACQARGTVEKTAAGLAFTGIRLDVRVKCAAHDVGRTMLLLDAAKTGCLVANSLRCPVTVETDVTANLAATGDEMRPATA
jgi:organic hydroperoxide reductase OsmC/OhrA